MALFSSGYSLLAAERSSFGETTTLVYPVSYRACVTGVHARGTVNFLAIAALAINTVVTLERVCLNVFGIAQIWEALAIGPSTLTIQIISILSCTFLSYPIIGISSYRAGIFSQPTVCFLSFALAPVTSVTLDWFRVSIRTAVVAKICIAGTKCVSPNSLAAYIQCFWLESTSFDFRKPRC